MANERTFRVQLTGSGTWDLCADFRDQSDTTRPSTTAPKIVIVVNEGTETQYVFAEAVHAPGGALASDETDPSDVGAGAAGIPIPVGGSIPIEAKYGHTRIWVHGGTDEYVGGGIIR